jgi:4'-phosphopantetheinyl transferase EntD
MTQRVWWELRAVHHEKNTTMNFFEAVEKVAEIGIVLEYEEQSEDAKKIHDEILSMKRSFNFALINTKEIQQHKQMIGQNK